MTSDTRANAARALVWDRGVSPVSASGAATFAVIGSTIVILVASTWYRGCQQDFYRGIGWDELFTLRNYTWAGVNEDGTRRTLNRLGDIRQLATPSSKEFGIGVYCALGRWPEPNNHVIHSLLLNMTLPLFDQKEIGLRLPALLAATAFAFGVAFICWLCGWYATAPLAATIAFWHPYIVSYSQEARGYSLMLFLVVLFLIVSQKVAKSPTSIFACSALVMIAVAIFENTVNMAVDWVIPAYLVLIAWPTLFRPSEVGHQVTLLRKSFAVQALCIGLAGFVFLMDRLPYVYSASQQYGVPFHTFGEFTDLLQTNWHYLFSSPLLVMFAALGCIGMGLALRDTPGRGFILISCFAVLASVAHFAATMRFAYDRNLGFWLVPFLLGYACLGQRLIVLPPRFWQRVAFGIGVYCGTLPFLVPGMGMSLTDIPYEALRQAVSKLREHDNESSLALLGEGVPVSLQLDFPARWSDADVPQEPGSDVDLILLERTIPLPLLAPREIFASGRPIHDWPGAEKIVQDGVFTIVRLPCRVHGPESSKLFPKAVMLWYPSFESVAVSPDKVLAFLADSRLSYHPIVTRYQAKLEVFSRLTCVVATGRSVAETNDILERLREANRQFGGTITTLAPRME
jgi:hypothetical protein